MTDSCPNCQRPGNKPLIVIPVGDGTEETYRCRRCGHEWWCSWGPGRAADDWLDEQEAS